MVNHCCLADVPTPTGSSYCPHCGARLRGQSTLLNDEEVAALFEGAEHALRAGDGPRARRHLKHLMKLIGGGHVSSAHWGDEWERRFGPIWRSMVA